MATNWQTSYYRYRRYFTSLSQFYQAKKTRTYAGLILSLLTVIFFLVFAIRPTLITIAGLNRQIKDQEFITQKMEAKINQLNQAQQEYEALRGDLYLVGEALPESSQVSLLIKQIEALVYHSGTTLQTVRLGKTNLIDEMPAKTTAKEAEEQSIKFTLGLTGRYLSLKRFLQSLSSLRRVVAVQSLGFRSSLSEPENLTLTLEAKAYYLSPPK